MGFLLNRIVEDEIFELGKEAGLNTEQRKSLRDFFENVEKLENVSILDLIKTNSTDNIKVLEFERDGKEDILTYELMIKYKNELLTFNIFYNPYNEVFEIEKTKELNNPEINEIIPEDPEDIKELIEMIKDYFDEFVLSIEDGYFISNDDLEFR